MPVAGTAVIAVFSFLLYQDMTRSAGAGRTEQVGTITFKRQVAQRKYSSQVVWDDIQQNAPVYNYDTIRTADISEAVIRLKDGTQIALNENSMILLSVTKDDVRVEFERGSLNASRGNAGDGGLKKLSISAGNTSVLVGKGSINLAQGLDKALSLTLNKGDATIKAGSGEKLVGADEKVVVTGDEMRVYKLNIRLRRPQPNEYIITASEKIPVAFSWEPVKNGYDLFLEISPEFAFTNIIEKQKAAGIAATAALRTGVYYWRITALQRATGKIESSEVRRLVILRSVPLELVTPRDGTVFRYASRPPIVNFKWSESEAECEYGLIIARDSDFKDIIKNIQLESSSLALDDLEGGAYFWKITRKIKSAGEAAPVSSRVHRLAIEKTSALQPPGPLFPADRAAITVLAQERENITFTWNKNSDLQAFRLSIAQDKNFSRVLFAADSTSNFLRLEKALGKGTYYWHVAGVSGDKEATAPSEVREFSIVDAGALRLLKPSDGAVISSPGDERAAAADFAWKRADVSGKYRLQISPDNAFSSLAHDITADDNGYTVSRLAPGDYYWRVMLLDENGAELIKSDSFRFTVKESLASPAVITPGSGSIVDMSDKDALLFRWREAKGANLYRVGVYQRRGAVNVNIFEKETAGTELSLGELEKLDVGNFYWTVQAFEVHGRGNIVRRSGEVKSEFRITLKKFADKPKVKAPKKFYVE